jgi:oligoribonuclease
MTITKKATKAIKIKKSSHLIWLDLEMTGLVVSHDHILEIATVVTDSELNVLAEGPVMAIHQPSRVLDQMDEWNTEHHTKSGLVARVQQSDITEKEAEQLTLDFVASYVPANKSPICGNSICMDRRFLSRWMPQLEKYFHYRNLDVSTIKELAKRWAPKVYQGVKKTSKHLALADIHESIAELRHYRKHFFTPQ